MNLELVVQLTLFFVVGVWNTLFDFSIFWILLRVGKSFKSTIIQSNVAVFAHMSSFLVANIVSYFLNRTFTFSSSGEDRGIVLYAMVSILSLGISTSAMYLLTNKYRGIFERGLSRLPFVRSHIKRIPTLAKLVATALSMVSNFLGYKFIVFR